MAKRKQTTKRIGKTKVVTNPTFTIDADTPIPAALEFQVMEAVRDVLMCGIAIGRARATASGRKVRHGS